jgi:hypothetical protein
MIAQASPAAGPLRADPSKRVNYTLGLVLGVDEFQQDQLYHAAGRRGHNRLLHGYGTVWGLATAWAAGADPEIQVEPGIAIDPVGREICVPDRMCVKVARWLDRHRAALESMYPQPAAQPIPLAVVLCHRECPTDTVPVPGEPCRTQEDAMAASRIRESFELKLALRDDAPWGSPPGAAPTGLTVYRVSQPEEQAVRAFGLLLARVQSTTDEALGQDGEETLMEAVYALRTAADEGTLASPPVATDDPILLPAAEAPEILRRALRLWVTEVRPAIRAREADGTGCGGGDGESCVLLAEMDLAVTAGWAVGVNQPPLRQDLRPYLLHTRLLQEWLIAAGGEDGRPDVDSWASLQILGPNRVRVWLHHAEWLDLPKPALTVVINDQPLTADQLVEVPYAGIRNVWDVVLLQEMSDGDVVEVRFDTELVPLVHGPPPPLVDRIRGVRDGRKLRDDAAGLGDEGSGEGGETEDTGRGGVIRLPRPGLDGWSPATAERTGVTVADELRGPTGEYLDRYGWSLSAFTVYDRIQGGDLEGEYKLPIVVKIQQFPVDPATPLADQYLVSDGAKWLPRYLPDGTIDLQGRYPDSIVRGIQGTGVSATPPAADQYLVFDGTQWVPAHLPDGEQDLSGRYPRSTVVGLQGTPVSNAAPGLDQYLFHDQITGRWIPANLPDATGDLAGRYPSLEIAKLQTHEVAAADPGEGQVLAFVDGRWVAADAVGLLPAAGGDLDGAYPDPTVVRLRGRRIADRAPAEGDVLVYREGEGSPPEGEWTPEPIGFSDASDLAGAVPDTRIARLQGNAVDAPAPADGQVLRFVESSPPGEGRWIAADPSAAGAVGPAEGDLAGEYPAPRIARLQGHALDAEAPSDGQVLRYVESSPPGDGRWMPTWSDGGGSSGSAGGDLDGYYPSPTLARLQGRPVYAAEPAEGQVLVYRESSPPGQGYWATAYAPGGDTGGAAGGDLAGVYPDPRIRALQDVPLDAEKPETGAYLRFSGEAWTPEHAVHAPGGAYAIVAAGVFEVRLPDDAEPVSLPYNGLALSPVDKDGTWALKGFPYDPRRFVYVVKAMAEDGVVHLVRAEDELRIRIPHIVGSDNWALVHVEVSAFRRLNPRLPNEKEDVGSGIRAGRTNLAGETVSTAETSSPALTLSRAAGTKDSVDAGRAKTADSVDAGRAADSEDAGRAARGSAVKKGAAKPSARKRPNG